MCAHNGYTGLIYAARCVYMLGRNPTFQQAVPEHNLGHNLDPWEDGLVAHDKIAESALFSLDEIKGFASIVMSGWRPFRSVWHLECGSSARLNISTLAFSK